MFIIEETVDDLMRSIFEKLIDLPFNITASRSSKNGNMSELVGVMLQLKNPRARLSRTETKGKPFSALGELLWYLSGDKKLDFIEHYIPRYKEESKDGKTIYGGYGPRLFNMRRKYNQVINVIKLLKQKPSTRRAAIQLFDAKDISKNYIEIPCTCTLQFLLRDNLLHMVTYMRSNDAFWGLPHDIFTFTMLQEIVARSLNVEIGTYKHSVGSLHLYEGMKPDTEQYLREGLQPTNKPMRPMPIGSPWPSIKFLLKKESKIRKEGKLKNSDENQDAYWNDLIYLLEIHSLFKQKKYEKITEIKQKINPIYITYIDTRLANIKQKETK